MLNPRSKLAAFLTFRLGLYDSLLLLGQLEHSHVNLRYNANATLCQIGVRKCGRANRKSLNPLWPKSLPVGGRIGLERAASTMSI